MSAYFVLFWVLLGATCIAAFRWGGWPEKTVAGLYIVAALATVLTRPALLVRYQHVEQLLLIIDVLLLAGLVLVAMRADRWWPICATALQMISTLAHLAAIFNPNLWRLGYALMEEASSYPVVLLLAFGTWRQYRVKVHRAVG